MRCEDCIHYDKCSESYEHIFGNKYQNEVETICNTFKDKSLFVELPCKVGDTVYYVLDYGSVKGECVCVEKGKIRAIEMREKYIWIEVLYEDFVSKHHLRNIGETVFLTREEAEKKLKELQE